MPLHYAALDGCKAVAALLLERGADKEAKDKVSVPMHVGPAAALPHTSVDERSPTLCECAHTCIHTFTLFPHNLKGTQPQGRGGGRVGGYPSAPPPPSPHTCVNMPHTFVHTCAHIFVPTP